MTIHSDHPFAAPEPERDPLRRVRGRLAAPVTVWACGTGRERVGLTVSSVLVVEGEPAHLLGLIDPLSDLAERLVVGQPCTVSVLAVGQEFLAGAMAGHEPAPGGPFTIGAWNDTPAGPHLAGAAAVVEAVVSERREVGWSLLVEVEVTSAAVGHADPLILLRGAFQTVSSTPGR